MALSTRPHRVPSASASAMSAVARPMPEPAPATTTVLPVSSKSAMATPHWCRSGPWDPFVPRVCRFYYAA